MRVINLVNPEASVKNGILVNRGAITVGAYPELIIVPVINLPEGANRVKYADPYFAKGRLVLKALDEQESELSEFCIVILPEFMGAKDDKLENIFSPESGVTILATKFRHYVDALGWHSVICKVPLGQVINYHFEKAPKRLLVESNGTVKCDGEIGDLVSPEELDNLTRAIDDGSATPA